MDKPCPGTCQVYGNGHYQTFDSKWYRFDGHCQYTLVEVRPLGGLIVPLQGCVWTGQGKGKDKKNYEDFLLS